MTAANLSAAVVLAGAVLTAQIATADVTIVEKLSATVGGKTMEGTRTTQISGERMRIETVLSEEIATTIFDLPSGSTITLNTKSKRAEVRDMAARAAAVEKTYPRARVETSLKPAGTAREIVSVACNEQAFTIRVPMTKDGGMALVLAGSACVATHAGGAAAYEAFAKAARAHDMVLGPASNNRILLARTRAQTELYRALTAVDGIPVAIEMTFAVDGGGMLAGMVRKVLAGTQLVNATSVTTTAVPASMFTVPDGWKRERK